MLRTLYQLCCVLFGVVLLVMSLVLLIARHMYLTSILCAVFGSIIFLYSLIKIRHHKRSELCVDLYVVAFGLGSYIMSPVAYAAARWVFGMPNNEAIWLGILLFVVLYSVGEYLERLEVKDA